MEELYILMILAVFALFILGYAVYLDGKEQDQIVQRRHDRFEALRNQRKEGTK